MDGDTLKVLQSSILPLSITYGIVMPHQKLHCMLKTELFIQILHGRFVCSEKVHSEKDELIFQT
jgi:hypothetical protein